MADAEQRSDKDLFAVVFDPNVDFKKIFSSASSLHLSYFGIFRQNISGRQKQNYLLPVLPDVPRPRSVSYSFEEGSQCNQFLVKNFSSFIDKDKKVTNVAEVHRFKLPAQCFNKACSAFYCSVNSILPVTFIQNTSTTNSTSNDNSLYIATPNFGYLGGSAMENIQIKKFSNPDEGTCPAIHALLKPQTEVSLDKVEKPSNPQNKSSNMQKCSKSHLILIPHEDKNGHQHEVIQEVYQYPPESLETVVENKISSKPSNNPKSKKKYCKRKINSSQTSLESSNSAVSGKSVSSVTSKGESLSQSSSISTLNISDKGSSKSGPTNPGSGNAFAQHYERENELASDTSSTLSTMSDLSGYEDEYTMIKRLVSDDPRKFFPKKHVTLNESMRQKSYLETKVQKQENVIKELNCQKEDLEIQVHRLTVQLQNAVREKEISQEHVDIMQTKLTEKNQQEYFELLKVKVNLEGQNEALKQELQHCFSTNSELEGKFRQSENEKQNIEKENGNLRSSETILQESLAVLRQENLKNKRELEQAKEDIKIKTNSLGHCTKEIENKDNTIKELQLNNEALQEELKSCVESTKSLKKWNSEYSEREEKYAIEKKRIESLLSESVEKFNSLRESSNWYQEQLSKSQKLYSDLQNELSETKTALSVISDDRDRCKREMERLNVESEDNRVKAMRDKSLLLVQLEELEADMRERESVIKRLEEGGQISHVKISEERFRKLEEDHKQLQEVKIELRDVLRHNEGLKDEIKYKITLLRKSEETVRDLKKTYAVATEELNSKQVYIDSLKGKLNEAKIKFDKVFEKGKEYEVIISQLKEQKLQLEASALTSEQDKKQVDETIIRLKEDLSKLSSNFFRMKHDLSAKDKQINLLSIQNSQLTQAEKELTDKNIKLETQVKEFEKKELVFEDINKLKELLSNANSEKNKLRVEISDLQKSYNRLEIERKSLASSINLRDEQIENLQGVIDAYKEKILQKDEDLFMSKDQINKLEANYAESQKKYNSLNNDYQLLLQEKDEFNQLEMNYKNTVVELRDNVKMEKRAKDNLEKKYADALLELKNISKQNQDKESAISNLDKKNTELLASLDYRKSQENEIRILRDKLDLQNNLVADLQKTVPSLKENIKIADEKYEQTVKFNEKEISRLKESLTSKNLEMEKLELHVNELKQKKDLKSTRHQNQTSANKVNGNSLYHKQSHRNGKIKSLREEHLKMKKKETLNTITDKDREIETLQKLAADHKRLKILYDRNVHELDDLKKNYDEQKKENYILNEGLLAHQRDIENISSDLFKKNNECNDWREKYQNLSDTIPQRDTNAFQNSNNDHHNFTSSYPSSFMTSIQSHHDRTNFSDASDSHFPDFNLEERVNFSQTMVYLQKQISMAAEALKNKDLQIMELNKKVAILSSSEDDNISSTELQKPNKLYIDVSTTTDGEFTQHETSELEEIQQSLSLKESEFKEKKRRYESNLRLLTRKLKEHMKGRRAAEKELKSLKEDHEKNLETEGKKYEALKTKFLELEKDFQSVQSKISSCELGTKTKDATIKNLKGDLETERKIVLQMQKDIGKIEQMQKCMENMRCEINELNTKVDTKDKDLSALNENLKTLFNEKRVVEESYKSSLSKVEELTFNLDKCMKKLEEKDEIICSQVKTLEENARELSNLKSDVEKHLSKSILMEKDFRKMEEEKELQAKELSRLYEDVKSLNNSVNMKNNLIEDLDAKKDILEREIQIKQDSLDNIKSECAALRKRIQETEQKHNNSVAILNKKLLEAEGVESALNSRINLLHKEKILYQGQCTELKISLNSAIEKLQVSSLTNLPSPSPLNTETITKLMEKCTKPKQGPSKGLNTLTERLNSLRNEVSVLQTEIETGDQKYQT